MIYQKAITWDNVTTNPNMHDEENFVYLVHAINLETKFLRDKIRIMENGFDKSQDIDLSKRPMDINKLRIISCSLIGKGKIGNENFEQLHTWAKVGLILKVPKQNVLCCGLSDLGSNFVDSEQEIIKYSDKVVAGPVNLLFNSEGYNEVVVMGSTSYGQVEVIGVFSNEYDDYLSLDDIELANRLSIKTNTRIVRIKRRQETLSDEKIHFEFDEKGNLSKLIFIKNNRKFYCNFSNFGLRWGIYASGDYGAPFVKNPEDFRIFMNEIENLSDEDKDQYSDIIGLIPQQYELCQKYFKGEATEEELHQFDDVINKYNKEVQPSSHSI